MLLTPTRIATTGSANCKVIYPHPSPIIKYLHRIYVFRLIALRPEGCARSIPRQVRTTMVGYNLCTARRVSVAHSPKPSPRTPRIEDRRNRTGSRPAAPDGCRIGLRTRRGTAPGTDATRPETGRPRRGPAPRKSPAPVPPRRQRARGRSWGSRNSDRMRGTWSPRRPAPHPPSATPRQHREPRYRRAAPSRARDATGGCRPRALRLSSWRRPLQSPILSRSRSISARRHVRPLPTPGHRRSTYRQSRRDARLLGHHGHVRHWSGRAP